MANKWMSFPEQFIEDEPRRNVRKSLPESQYTEEKHELGSERNVKNERGTFSFPAPQTIERGTFSFPESQIIESSPFPESQSIENELRNERSVRNERGPFSFPELQRTEDELRNEGNVRNERKYFQRPSQFFKEDDGSDSESRRDISQKKTNVTDKEFTIPGAFPKTQRTEDKLRKYSQRPLQFSKEDDSPDSESRRDTSQIKSNATDEEFSPPAPVRQPARLATELPIRQIQRTDRNDNKIKVIFHVHLPENIEKYGNPVVLGDVKELGLWEKFNVKLRQPFPQNPTYWQSDSISISLSNLAVKDEIRYKYAITIKNVKERIIVFEGGDKDGRTLNIRRNDQFDIWISQDEYPLDYNNIRDFAFVNYIYNKITKTNLKDKIMEYQHLLALYEDLTNHASNLGFIFVRIDEKLREKRIFLCFLLGCYIQRQGASFELPDKFPSTLLLEVLKDYKQDTLPSDSKDQMYTAIISLVRHNAFDIRFDWLVIFEIAAEVDPNYTFIDHLKTLKYPNDKMLGYFVKNAEIIRPHVKDLKFETYVRLSKWLINLCQNMESLFKIWNNVVSHKHVLDESISRCFIERVQENITRCDSADTLEHQFKTLPIDFRDDTAEIFRKHALYLLESSDSKWTDKNITAIKNLFNDDGMKWQVELTSQTCTLELLNIFKIFPELLDYWVRSDYSDNKEDKMSKICIKWFKDLLNNRLDVNEGNFIFSTFQRLELLYPFFGERVDIWRELTNIAMERVEEFSEAQFFVATKLIEQIKYDDVKKLFLDKIKEILSYNVKQVDNQLLNKIFIICDCNSNNKTLEVPNVMSEEILCHIMTILQNKSAATATSLSENHLNILKDSYFWITILRATGSVTKLNSKLLVKNVKASINELAESLLNKTVNIQLLRQILEYPDETLIQHFEAAKSPGISQDEIEKSRTLCKFQPDVLFEFYDGFCSAAKVTDVDDYIQDVKQHMKNLNKASLKQLALHEKMLVSARRCQKFYRSQTFRNVFEAWIREDDAATKVEYIAQELVPIVFEKYNAMCEQLFKDWEKFKCSDAYLLWKNVTDVNAELDLMGIDQSQVLVQTLDHLSKVPGWIERLEQLGRVLEIFKIQCNEEWLSKSIHTFKDESMELGQLDKFFYDLSQHLPDINQDFWNVIKELSVADKFMGFLEKISEHDINGYDINGADDYLDEILIQEDVISSLFQVKVSLRSLMDKRTISDFFDSLLLVIEGNRSLRKQVAICNSSDIALQNMYNNISDRRAVVMEEIKNAVLNGNFIFTRDEKENKCLVSLKYPSNHDVKYDMNEILDLRRRTLLVATVNRSDKDVSKNMDEFVARVNIAQEITIILSILIKAGHLDYRKFEKKFQKTNEMKNCQKNLNEEIEKWRETMDEAHKKCYYLTFFSAQHILSFYDYFTSEPDEKNEEECKTLIKYVNCDARLPSHKDIQGILHGSGSKKSKNNLEILCDIGNELKRICKNVSKPRKPKAASHNAKSDTVTKGKLFVAAYADNTPVSNVIMTLFANYGYYPERWQILICTTSTTMEELTTFVKRSFLAPNNGCENHLFCIANLELLDFELQHNFVSYIKAMQLEYTNKNYLLALLCCKKSGMSNYILDQFSLEVHEIDVLDTETMQEIYQELCPNVICVSSDLSGQGKTEWIKESSYSKQKIPYIFLISDGMDLACLVKKLKGCNLKEMQSLHINILSTDYSEDVNIFLFELLTFKVVSCGEMIVSVPETFIFIEISSVEPNFINNFPILRHLDHKHLSWKISNFRVSQEITSSVQVACHFLNLYDLGKVDKEELTLNSIQYPISEELCQYFIMKYFLNESGTIMSSFKYIENFVNILADQLVRFSSCQYFTKLKLKETGVKSTITKSLIDISRDAVIRTIRTKSLQIEPCETNDFDKILSDNSNHSILFFNSQTPNSFSTLYRDENQVPDNIKSLLKSQIIGNTENWELDDYNKMSANELLTMLETMARTSSEKLNLPKYALSIDNLITMALILLRVRAKIPVVICGEAGCGKTSLITYLAMLVEVQFQALNLHAGIDEETIIMFMNDALKKAEEGEIWILFDEINTCNHLGLLADLISNRTFQDKPIHPNVHFFSACNPYRFRTRAQIEDYLTNNINEYEERSNLVYQVNPLPDQILDYAWYCNTPRQKDEFKYIQVMVENELKELANPILVELLFASQKFIRKVEKPYSVSLRDIQRSIALVKFFYSSLKNRPAYKRGHKYPPDGNPTKVIRSYVLALSLCYHSRLCEQDLRKQYCQEMEQILQNHDCVGEHTFAKIVRDEQEDYINRMEYPSNVVKNEALLENVLVMIACILTRSPLFLIGPSGSSKSLAIHLICSNLRGPDSDDMYFKELPHIYLVPYISNSLSTSDSLIKVFDKARKYQETTPEKISVVLLDNVELAETSPSDPLKVLHFLLEPSYPATGPTVSVIGISNRRLDNGKISRALLVQRPRFDLDGAVDTAEHLLNAKDIEPGIRDALRSLAKSYLDYEKHGQALPNFHGLRDYYTLVNRLSLDEMTPENIQMSLSHNFGGMKNNFATIFERYFKDALKSFNNDESWSYKPIPVKQLIYSNLGDPNARHLMVVGKSVSIVNSLTHQLRNRSLDPVVILGSQFPDDHDDYAYSVLSKIMTCVKAGGTLILTDLEIIYGCLYDLWDPNCIMTENKRNVNYFTRIALGTYANPMFYVPPGFKCILVMDEVNLPLTDPALFSRFEKQRMSINDILDDRQELLVGNLSDWANKMSTLNEADSIIRLRNTFTQKDLFIGFDKDETLQSLVINITRYNPEAEDDEILEKCKECLIAISSSDGIVRAEKSTLEWDEVDRWKRVYFDQHNSCLNDYIDSLINQEKFLADTKGQLVIVNTFSSINVDIKHCLQELLKYQVYNLSTFRTEAQLSDTVKNFYSESTDQVLIIQCDITAINAKCINLAKCIIEQFRDECFAKKEISIKHVFVILHIKRNYEPNLISTNFTFGWKQITIESLETQKISLINLLDKSLYDIIESDLFGKIVDSTTPFEKILKDELPWCLSCIEYQHSNESEETFKNHISMLNKEIINNPGFIQCIKAKTFEWINENCENWKYELALNKEELSKFTCFSLALQNQVKIIIKQTITKVLYSLEKLSATKTLFNNENIKEPEMKKELSELWKRFFMSNEFIDIYNLCEPKPSAYTLPLCTIINDLKFPFSNYFMNQINYYKDCYYEELDILDILKQDLEDDKLNEEDHVEDFKEGLISINPNFESLQKHSELYYNDFINIILSTYTEKLTSNKELDFVLRHLIGDKIVNDPFALHIYWWKYAENILVQLKLVETIPHIIAKAQTIHEKLDLYLFNESINFILQNICDDKPWEQSMNIILSINDKINDSKSISNLHLLFICNDLLKINSIPLEKVKEIIHSVKSAKKQEFITADIINLVFVSLDNNNDDIIPIRSFISRSLKLISLESEVRLVLYKNLFARNPFKLANNIIEKIFITEYQQDKQIFFMLINNPEEVLRLSNRLHAINDNIKSIDSNMAELCCEMIQKIFSRFELNELSPYFQRSIEINVKQRQMLVLQQITSIAFLKEFLCKFCNNYIQDDNSLSKSLIQEINDIMKIDQYFIQFLQYYFVLYLNQQNDEILMKEFPWLENVTDTEMIHLPGIWIPNRRVNFEDFHTFYNLDYMQNLDKYPFLAIFFKNCERLTLVKYLYPIIRFVKILSLKLEYHLTREAAYTMTFHEFIKQYEKEYNNLESLFEEFAFGWNSVINYITQYQSKELPVNKPIMNHELPVIFGLIEQKDTGVYLCAILDFLIGLHNEFLDSVMAIPIGKCESLKFLEDSSWNHQMSKKYFVSSKKVVQALDINLINYEWNNEILKHNQRNSETTESANFIFDLQKIEMKLAKKLVLDKVYFEMEDNQFYMKNFSFKHELFHKSPRILFDIKKVLPQDPISADKMLKILAMFHSSSSISSSNSVDLSELFFLFETILCFIKEISIKNNNLTISDFVDQWLKLARYNVTSTDILEEFSLNNIVEFYELIEEQVGNSKIHGISDKFKDPLTQEMKDSINNAVDYYGLKDKNKQLISAKEFATALKRFIYRFLLIDSDIENLSLNVYFLDFTLGLWKESIQEESVEKLFPDCLFVSHAYNSYTFVVYEIEKNKNITSAQSSSNTRKKIRRLENYRTK